MAHFLAIDWDNRECRYLLAHSQVSGMNIAKVGSVKLNLPAETVDIIPLSNNETSDEDFDEDDSPSSDIPSAARPDEQLSLVVASIKNLLKEEHVETGATTLICLGRGKVELLYQTLPPCQASEVPVLLKNQVLRELSSYSDFDPLDYIDLSEEGSGEQKLLALTIPLSFRQALVRAFRSIGRPPKQIGFRASAATSLIFGSEIDPDDHVSALIVSEVGRDVDLIQIEGRRMISFRSFRLPEQSTPENDMLRIVDEVGRTITIGSDDSIIHPIKRIYVFGSQEEKQPFTQLFSDDSLEIVVLNPFEIPGITVPEIPRQPERFAPLLGLVSEQKITKKDKSASFRVDFLHPKEAPKPVNLIRFVFLAIVLLLIVGYGLYHWNHGVVQDMEQDLAKLQQEYQEVSTQYRQVQPAWNVLRQTAFWDSQSVVWLDELRALSVSLPGEQDLVISQITFSTGGANPRIRETIQISGMVRDPSVLQAFQKGLHSSNAYQMRNPDLARNPAGGGYPWLFRTTINRLKR